MGRIFRRGGTWKNHEDEVLKSAVMKYGKTQWQRVASLLPKKTAAQAKERWNSWLDPNIKKTEWTKEEEEKLLHLAKRLPCQWRTIAPIVGRTPYQCLEHYEKLLDQAQEKDEGYDPENDPKRLRPGEIDPNPEQKPAKPDSHDMSDDEKEMLNEARARLANTLGKKAKRKARGKQLEEARRLAAVQKRRELKAAGIELPEAMKKKRRGINFATEIPFYKPVQSGFFDTSEELKRKRQDDKNFDNLDVQKAEGTMRQKDELEARKEDKKKALKRKEEDLPAHFEALNKKVDPGTGVRKAGLSMPAPQVTDKELHALRRMGQDAMDQAHEARLNARTERSVTVSDNIRLEAENQAMLQSMQTPLLGGETPQLNRIHTHGAATVATPNLATPAQTPSVYGQTLKEQRKEQAKRDKVMKAQASLNRAISLRDLPEAKREVALALRAEEEEEEADRDQSRAATADGVRQLDASDAAEKDKKKDAQLSTATEAVRRGVPRPAAPVVLLRKAAPSAATVETAAFLIEQELRKLVNYDVAAHPTAAGKKPKRAKIPDLHDIPQKQLNKAAAEIRRVESVLKRNSRFFKEAPPHAAKAAVAGFVLRNEDELLQEISLADDDFLILPNPPRVVSKRNCSLEDRLTSLQYEFEVLRTQTLAAGEKAAKSEKKADLLTAGYVSRFNTLKDQLLAARQALKDASVQLASFEHVWSFEEVAIGSRTAKANERLQRQKEKEASLQARYADLKQELGSIRDQAAAKRKRREAEEAELAELEELEGELQEERARKKPRA
ncbi:Cell division cycle 5-like protein [Diplonema papillatum]|nr:Cell division cycle 5-like protein [Diplonema papillatum]WGM49983.1 CDC5L [Diplonema papillatum]